MTELQRTNDLIDLETILALDIVKDVYLEDSMGFGYGVLNDGRPFCYGRANGPLEMDIYSDVESMENGFEAVEFKTVLTTSSIIPE